MRISDWSSDVCSSDLRDRRELMTVSPLTARKTWRTLEPIHGYIYFAPEAVDAYAALGVVGRSGYFGSRSAPMGAVPAEVVIATFFNFDPGLVRHAMDGLWDTVDRKSTRLNSSH